MSPEKEDKLFKDFPHLFRDKSLSMLQTTMCWGCDCLDGWEPIIREACSKVEPIVTKMIDDAIKTNELDKLDYIPAFSQIKEKYARLCLYLTCSTDEIDKIIEVAENKSKITCEQCGNRGKIRGNGWLYCRCAKCWKKLQEEREY